MKRIVTICCLPNNEENKQALLDFKKKVKEKGSMVNFGLPTLLRPNETEEERLKRLCAADLSTVCGVISDIHISVVRHSRQVSDSLNDIDVLAVAAEIEPYGPFAEQMAYALDESVNQSLFSIYGLGKTRIKDDRPYTDYATVFGFALTSEENKLPPKEDAYE